MRFGILTISDRSSRGERPDLSGPALVKAVQSLGWQVNTNTIVPDSIESIRAVMIKWADSDELDVILSTGGTGFAPRVLTPEATRTVVERLTPGLDEAMRANSLRITPHAMLSRAISGIRGKTILVNLPGSPKAAVENFDVISPVLEHASQLLREDSNSEKGHATFSKG
jgi:molybdopterin adenylyltransferase